MFILILHFYAVTNKRLFVKDNPMEGRVGATPSGMDGFVGDTAFQQLEGVGELLETGRIHKGVSCPSFPTDLRLTGPSEG